MAQPSPLFEAQQKSPVHTEMDDDGRMRIVSSDGVGEWAGYYSIAALEAHGQLLIAVTAYHEGCGLEPEVVYAAQPVYG